MAQYTTITAASPMLLSNGVTEFGYYVSGDMTLRQNGNDLERWVDSGGGRWRVGVRSTYWVIDCTITATGFSGAENTHWENIESHKLSDSIFRASSSVGASTSILIDKSRI